MARSGKASQDTISRFLLRQSRVLDLVAGGGELREALAAFCRALEGSLDGSRCAVMLLDGDSQTMSAGAAPNLPEEFLGELEGLEAGSAPGSSSAALHRNQLIFTEDVLSDPLWGGLDGAARAASLVSCWSAPIRSTGRGAGAGDADTVQLLGTVDCYFGETREPAEDERQALELAATLAGVVINLLRANESIGRQQLYDPVTELPNRRVFTRELRHALAEISPQTDKLALLLIDLDHFKEVNDTFGYAVGDFLLRSVGEKLVSFRGSADVVARFGDDEFGLLVSGIATGEDVRELARQVLLKVSEPHDFSGQQLKVSASVGGAIYPWDGEDSQTLMRNAENALYAAKSQGRSHFRLYAPTMGGSAFETLQLKMALGYAVDNRELEIRFQPKVRGSGHQIVGAEALTYWNHPAKGLLGPSEFIPLAEETGQIVPIGEWVLREACRQAHAWRDGGHHNLAVAVNISAIQFRERGLARSIGEILRQTRLKPSALELEITESVAMSEVEATQKRLNDLASLGVRLSIDDFGTGYSSLAYLKRFPIDTLKIDKSFILTTPKDKENLAIVKAVIALAHLLGLSVVAEGVETSEQAAYLRSEGCELLQGFYFSRPVPAEEFSRLLASGPKPRERTH